MRDSKVEVEEFILALSKHAEQKSMMYDSTEKEIGIERTITYAVEELGEVATACVRDRWLLAWYECLDLAHCAMLIALNIKRCHRQEFDIQTAKESE